MPSINLFVILSVILFLVYLELAIYVLFRNTKSPLNLYFFFLSLCFAIWSFSYIFVYSAPTAEIASYWDSLASIGYALFPAFMVGFKSRLTNYPVSVKWQNIIFSGFLITGFLFVYLVFSSQWKSPEISRGDLLWHFSHDPGSIYYKMFYVYIFLSTCTTMFYLMVWRQTMTEKREIYQFRLIFFPLILFLVLGVFFDLVLPAMQVHSLPNMGHITSMFWIAGIAIAIIKFQLLGSVKYLIADQIIDQIKEIVIFLDTRNIITRTNDFTEKLLDESAEELIGKDIYAYFDNNTLLSGFLKKTYVKPHFGPVNMTMKSPNANHLDVNLYFLSIRNNFDDILGCVIYGHDNREALNLQKEIIVRQHAEKNLRTISEVLETRVKERTNELANSYKELQVKMTERMRVEEQIKADISEKEVLINEIHSRVKNNMNVIIALINTQNKKSLGPVAFGKFNALSQRVRSLLLVHHNLYLSINYSDVDFAGFIKTLAKELMHYYKKQEVVELRVDVSDVFLDVDYAIPLGIVVNELISNSLQHAFSSQYLSKNKGKKHILYLKYIADNNQYEISVSDNGKGLPKGFVMEELRTNGLPLVEILVQDQVNGNLIVKASNEGCSFDISFHASK